MGICVFEMGCDRSAFVFRNRVSTDLSVFRFLSIRRHDLNVSHSDSLKRELSAKGLDLSTVDNIGVLKWVKSQDDLGKGRQAVDEIYKAYETESNPWSPFFKVAGVGKNKTRDLSRKNGPKK